MEIHQLRYFLATSEAGSISRAAERCGIAQPSLSQQIRKLEQTLGISLFDRIGRGVALTDAGRALLPRARRIIAEVVDAEANLVREAAHGGPITVGIIPTMAPYLLPRAYQRLRDEVPDAEVTINETTTEELVDALLDNRLDCALLSTPIDHDLIDLDVLGEDELLLVLPPAHPLAERTEVGWSAVRGQPTITLGAMHCLSRQIEAFCTARGTALRTLCRSTQLSTVFELVAMGLGVSIVPEMAALRQGSERWRYARLAQPRPSRQIAIAWRRDRTRPRLAERLGAIIGAQCREGLHRLPRQAGGGPAKPARAGEQ